MSTTKLNHSAVALPAGSFDVQKLSAKLDKAATLDDDAKRDDAVAKALKDSDQGQGTSGDIDQGARVDQTRLKVTREDLGTTESVLVHDEGSDAAKESADRAEEDAERLAAQTRARAEGGSVGTAPATTTDSKGE